MPRSRIRTLTLSRWQIDGYKTFPIRTLADLFEETD